MEITVEPLAQDDIDIYTKIYWDAFNPLEANMILPMIYPLGLQPDLNERLRKRIWKAMSDPVNDFSCARDTATGEVVGVSWWKRVDNPPANQRELDEQYREAKASRNAGIEVEGMNHKLEDAFFHAAFYSEAETMGHHAYMTLKLLAVRPNYARKGVGSVLLGHGLKRLDQRDLPGFIHAGVQAKALYERYGFVEVGEMPCNALAFGGRSDGRHWCMVRTSRSQRPVEA